MLLDSLILYSKSFLFKYLKKKMHVLDAMQWKLWATHSGYLLPSELTYLPMFVAPW